MAVHVCPWWLGYVLVSPLRRLVQDPQGICQPFVQEGMTVLEPGPGMGFFTLELARLVGPRGRVIAVDLQPKMLDGLKRRASRAGLAQRIELRLASNEDLCTSDLAGKVDFVLAFAMVHELSNIPAFFREVSAALRPGGRVLLAEPRGHVSPKELDAEIAVAREAGLNEVSRPQIRRSHAALLRR